MFSCIVQCSEIEPNSRVVRVVIGRLNAPDWLSLRSAQPSRQSRVLLGKGEQATRLSRRLLPHCAAFGDQALGRNGTLRFAGVFVVTAYSSWLTCITRRVTLCIYMQPLPLSFEEGRFTLTQIERTGQLAIYSKANKDTGAVSFEIVKIRSRPAGSHTFPDGREVYAPARERYPSSEEWGNFGWTESTLERAKNRLMKLSGVAV